MRAIERELSQREKDEFEQEKEIAELQAQYQLQYKELELKLKKLEVSWTQVFRLPMAVIMLPVRFLFVFGYIVHAIRKTEPSDKFWDYLTKY